MTSEHPDGVIEVKCPYSKREVTPREACSDPKFYCELVNSEIRLKSSHIYYHQVQLQMYVGADLYQWCDFCVFTCKGLSIQRIFPDSAWQEKYIPELESFFDNCTVPKIVMPKYKPTYIL